MNAENAIQDRRLIDPGWKGFLRVGGYASLLTLVLAIVELLITFLPGGNVAGLDTIVDWFNFFESNPFMGLRTLGLVNFGLIGLGIPVMIALFGVLHKFSRGWVLMAIVLSFIGAGVFFSTNRAFPMLVLSNEYAAATSDAQRAMLEAAGTVMVSVGIGHRSDNLYTVSSSIDNGFQFPVGIGHRSDPRLTSHLYHSEITPNAQAVGGISFCFRAVRKRNQKRWDSPVCVSR